MRWIHHTLCLLTAPSALTTLSQPPIGPRPRLVPMSLAGLVSLVAAPSRPSTMLAPTPRRSTLRPQELTGVARSRARGAGTTAAIETA